MLRKPKLLIIEAGDQEFRFLCLEKGLWGKFSYASYHSYPYKAVTVQRSDSPDKKAILEILENYRSDSACRMRLPVYLLIPFKKGLVREFKLPWINTKERDSAIHYYLQHEVPILADELVYDYQVTAEKEKDYLHIRVTAARKDIIEAYGECFKQAGYELKGIEYAISALGEVLKKQSPDRILCIQDHKENRTQMVLYKNGLPQVIRDFSQEQYDLTKYHINLEIEGHEFPIEQIITDGSVQAEKAACLFLDSGLVKKRITLAEPNLDSELMNEIAGKGFKAYALLGELLRIQDGNNIDFSKFVQRKSKVKALTAILGLFVIINILFGVVCWYPETIKLFNIQTEAASLESDLNKIETEKEQVRRKLAGSRTDAVQDLKKIQQALEQAAGITVTRLNYKEGKLYLWAQCSDSSAITKFIGKLTAEGWRSPVLIDYHYQKQKITFTISVLS